MKKLIFDKDTTIEEAIRLLDANGNGVLPVVKEGGYFIGLITDGDIRKALIKKHLDLSSMINKTPFTMNEFSTKAQRIQYLKKIKRRHLPIIDSKSGKLVEIFTLDDIEFNLKENFVVIMAGGLGSRLGELTKDTPKPMLKVGKKPILEIIIEKFLSQGFYKFYIAVNYKKEIIKQYFQDGSKFGAEITYIEEEQRLGTGGALSLIQTISQEPMIVTNGDIITDLNYEEVLHYHIDAGSKATMCTREYSHTIPYGVIQTSDDNKIVKIEEKPKINFFINSGIYVLNSELLEMIPKNQFYDLPMLFENLLECGEKPLSYKIDDYWIDIGRVEEYKKANEEVLI